MVGLHEGLTNEDKAWAVLMTLTKQQLIDLMMTAVSTDWIDLYASYYDHCIDKQYPPEA